MNTARQGLSGGKSGTQTAGIVFGGSPYSPAGRTELWNGTSWSNLPNMATGRTQLGGAGTQSAALGFGGYAAGNTAATEEWTGEVETANSKTLTVS